METHYILKIKDYLAQIQEANPSYSLRALARDFNLHSSSLSQVLKGKRPLPLKVAQEIAQIMKLTNKERTLFLESVHRLRLSIDDIEISKLDERFMLDDSYYKVIAEWEHYAVLSLFDLVDFQPEAAIVAVRLNIEVTRAQEVLNNLETSQLIKRDSSGRILKVHEGIRTTEDTPSKALDESHLETLELGKKKLELSKPLRDFSSTTLSIDMNKMSEAKTIIREFRQKMAALLKDGTKTEVYQLAVQFYPLTDVKELEEEV